jgi:hypothetical protein
MAFYLANRGLFHLVDAAVTGSTDIRAAVFTLTGATPTKAQIADLNFLADVEALTGVNEVTNSGYARLDLAGVTVTENDTTDKVILSATAPTTANIGAGDVWEAIAYYIEGASDAARTLIGLDVPASAFTPNGGPATVGPLQVELYDDTA